MQPQINTQEMHELPQTERQRERREDGKWKENISIGDNTRIRREQTKCWSNLFLLKCQLMLSAFCGFYHSSLPLCNTPPSHITHAEPWRGCFGLAPHVLVDDFCYMFFSWYSTVASASNWIQEKSLWGTCHSVCVRVCVLLFYGTWRRKNRNLLAVNFTHSPRSLRQTLVSLFVAITFVVVCMCFCCQNEKLLVWHMSWIVDHKLSI